jgi:hypothetical protein
VTGYEIGFRREASPGTVREGPAVVVSSASRFRTAEGAATALRDGSADIEAADRKDGTQLRRLSVGSPIGHEVKLYSEKATQGGVAGVTLVVVWRHGPILSYIVAWGLSGSVEPAQAIALARKQQTRIVRAVG